MCSYRMKGLFTKIFGGSDGLVLWNSSGKFKIFLFILQMTQYIISPTFSKAVVSIKIFHPEKGTEKEA